MASVVPSRDPLSTSMIEGCSGGGKPVERRQDLRPAIMGQKNGSHAFWRSGALSRGSSSGVKKPWWPSISLHPDGGWPNAMIW